MNNIENRENEGFHIGTVDHLHLYYQNMLLFYFEFLTENRIKFGKRNGSIKQETYDNYQFFYSVLKSKIEKSAYNKFDNFIYDTKKNKFALTLSNAKKDNGIFDLIYETLDAISQATNLAGELYFAEELRDEIAEKLTEGAKKQITVNSYERNQKAITECKKYYGTICIICGFDFEQVYGEIGKDYIHVHHLTPVSLIGKNYEINPVEDLRPVCPVCHAMLHRTKETLSIDELKKKMN